jgi:hypothetical protein
MVGEGNLQASLSEVEWIEVTIDPDSFESTPVEDGDCWSLSDPYSIDQPVESFE